MIGYLLPIRVLITVMVMLSWMVTTTHCALAAASAAIMAQTSVAETQSDDCPMHAAKHSPSEQPEKKSGCPDLPCCKNLPAAKPANSQWMSKPMVWLQVTDYLPAALDFLSEDNKSIVRLQLDTGPPGSDAFLELVLQRSTPANGPPLA